MNADAGFPALDHVRMKRTIRHELRLAPWKEALVQKARGFGFADAAGIFLGRVAEWQDTRTDYGEVRMVAVGICDGTFYTVVYTDRTGESGEPIRWIITAWPSHRKERALWQRSV